MTYLVSLESSKVKRILSHITDTVENLSDPNDDQSSYYEATSEHNSCETSHHRSSSFVVKLSPSDYGQQENEAAESTANYSANLAYLPYKFDSAVTRDIRRRI